MEAADPSRFAAQEFGVREGEDDVPKEREDVERDEQEERRSDEGPLQGSAVAHGGDVIPEEAGGGQRVGSPV
jgi:hypothetical protein